MTIANFARIVLLALAASGIALTAAAAEQSAAIPVIERTGDWRAAVRRFAEENLQHPAWGASHSLRNYRLAKELAGVDGVAVDDDVLYAAAYLHDVAAFTPFAKPGVDHQDQAADLVQSLLEGIGFPMQKIDAVRSAIRTHMYGRDPVGPEAIYLHDADALDWLGAIGIARVFALVDANGGSPDGPAIARRLENTLKTVPPRIVSKAGKARAETRVRELEEFLRNLQEQSADYEAL
jgi:HD superfamily phosphodiesterase